MVFFVKRVSFIYRVLYQRFHCNCYCLLQTIDPKFDEIEQKVVHLESLIRNLLRDIASWQEKLQVCCPCAL